MAQSWDMTEEKIASPSQSDNRDAKFINFTEGFAKAKRTSLTWSALALVVAAAPHWNENVRVMGTAIPYSQGWLGVLLLVVAAFYFAGFWRALSIVTVQNSKAAEEANETWNTLGKVIKGWRTKLDPVTGDIERIEGAAGNLKRLAIASTNRVDEFVQPIRNMVSKIEKRIAERCATTFVQESSDHTMGGHYLWQVSQDLPMLHELLNSGEVEMKANYQNDMVAAVKDDRRLRDSLARATEKIDRLEASLNTFRAAIEEPEKAWHRWHDKRPVVALFAAAAIAVAVRLVIGNPDDPAPTVHQVELIDHQSPGVQSPPEIQSSPPTLSPSTSPSPAELRPGT